MTQANETFEQLWRRHFPSTPPVSHAVRDCHLARWVRRHALPESKRYADTPEERAEILRRANVIAGELFRANPACWLTHALYYEEARHDPEIEGLQFAFVDADPTADEGGEKVAVYAKRVEWRSGAFDHFFGRIADDELSSVLWVSVETGAIFAPYDGGFDLILPTAREAEEFNLRWLDWRSDFPGGW